MDDGFRVEAGVEHAEEEVHRPRHGAERRQDRDQVPEAVRLQQRRDARERCDEDNRARGDAWLAFPSAVSLARVRQGRERTLLSEGGNEARRDARAQRLTHHGDPGRRDALGEREEVPRGARVRDEAALGRRWGRGRVAEASVVVYSRPKITLSEKTWRKRAQGGRTDEEVEPALRHVSRDVDAVRGCSSGGVAVLVENRRVLLGPTLSAHQRLSPNPRSRRSHLRALSNTSSGSGPEAGIPFSSTHAS